MAQAQALRPVTTVVTAQSQETTQGQSLALVQNLLRAGISEVAYLRNFFDEDCFSTSSLGATKVKVLAPIDKRSGLVRDEGALLLSTYLEAALEAISSRFLRSLVLSVHTGEAEPAARTLLESYVFDVSYPTFDEAQLVLRRDGAEAFSQPTVKDQALRMVRTLIRVCETLRPAVESRAVSIKLFYTADAPADYQPTHFVDSTHDTAVLFAAPPNKVTVGFVGSRHHGLTVKVGFVDGELAPAAVAWTAPTAGDGKVAVAGASGGTSGGGTRSGGADAVPATPSAAAAARAELLEAKAVILALQPAALMAGGSGGVSGAAGGGTLSLARMQAALGCGLSAARGLVAHLRRLGILASAPVRGAGSSGGGAAHGSGARSDNLRSDASRRLLSDALARVRLRDPQALAPVLAAQHSAPFLAMQPQSVARRPAALSQGQEVGGTDDSAYPRTRRATELATLAAGTAAMARKTSALALAAATGSVAASKRSRPPAGAGSANKKRRTDETTAVRPFAPAMAHAQAPPVRQKQEAAHAPIPSGVSSSSGSDSSRISRSKAGVHVQRASSLVAHRSDEVSSDAPTRTGVGLSGATFLTPSAPFPRTTLGLGGSSLWA